jgi:hypothetical protein
MRPFEYAFECEHVVFLAYEIERDLSAVDAIRTSFAISRQSGHSVRITEAKAAVSRVLDDLWSRGCASAPFS